MFASGKNNVLGEKPFRMRHAVPSGIRHKIDSVLIFKLLIRPQSLVYAVLVFRITFQSRTQNPQPFWAPQCGTVSYSVTLMSVESFDLLCAQMPNESSQSNGQICFLC